MNEFLREEIADILNEAPVPFNCQSCPRSPRQGTGMAPEKLKALAIEFAAALPPIEPERIFLVSSETFSEDALAVARVYQQAGHQARSALNAVAAAFAPSEVRS